MSGSGYRHTPMGRWRAMSAGLGIVAAMVATVAAPATRTAPHVDTYRVASSGVGDPSCPEWGCGMNHNQTLG
jgi:hypothetical protein